jgi:chromosome segregation ATPase
MRVRPRGRCRRRSVGGLRASGLSLRRVRIEHPDLPEELRDAAGEAIGALWQRAQALADANLATSRIDAQASVIQANAATEAAQARTDDAEQSLVGVRAELTASLARVQQLEQNLAREQGVRAALEHQLEQSADQRRELQRALEEARLGFERQLADQRDATKSAGEHHQADLRRALLDVVDRERSTSAKLQKELEQARRAVAEQAEQHRARADKLEGELAQLRQKLSGAEAALAEARAAGDQLRAHLDKALAKPARKLVVAKKVKS